MPFPRRWTGSVLALALMTACAESPGGTKRPNNANQASPAPSPSSKPVEVGANSPAPLNSGGEATASGTPSSIAPAPPPQRLQKPAGEVVTMRGVARLNPAYVVSSGAGQIIAAGGGNILSLGQAGIIAAGGGNVIAAGGGNVIAAGGGNVIAAGGGNVIAAGGGNVIAAGGGNVIAAGGGNLLGVAASNLLSGAAGSILASGGGNVIAAGGGNVIAAGGGNVIAAGGGNVIAAGGGNYRLMQSLSEGPGLPVAGLVISAFSLADHKPFPLGQDQNGQAVYNVLTDEKGGFEVFLPAEVAENIFLVGSAKPDSPDPRLAFGVLAQAGEKEVALDETANNITQIVREVFATRLARVYAAPTDEEGKAYIQDLVGYYSSLPKPIRDSLMALLQEFAVAGRQGGMPAGSYQARLARCLKLSDMALAAMNLEQVQINPALDTSWAGPEESALTAMREVFKKAEPAARTRLLQGPINPAEVFVRTFSVGDATKSAVELATEEGLFNLAFRAYTPDDCAFMLSRVLFANPNPKILLAHGVGEYLDYLGTSDIEQVHLDAALAAKMSPPGKGDRINAAGRTIFFSLIKSYGDQALKDRGLKLAAQPFTPDELAASQRVQADPSATAAQADVTASP